jgi:predicted Rdx family selenoprotein
MTAEEYQRIVENQMILDKKLDGIITEIKAIKKDVNTAINNQQLLEQYEVDITERLKRIENK